MAPPLPLLRTRVNMIGVAVAVCAAHEQTALGTGPPGPVPKVVAEADEKRCGEEHER